MAHPKVLDPGSALFRHELQDLDGVLLVHSQRNGTHIDQDGIPQLRVILPSRSPLPIACPGLSLAAEYRLDNGRLNLYTTD